MKEVTYIVNAQITIIDQVTSERDILTNDEAAEFIKEQIDTFLDPDDTLITNTQVFVKDDEDKYRLSPKGILLSILLDEGIVKGFTDPLFNRLWDAYYKELVENEYIEEGK